MKKFLPLIAIAAILSGCGKKPDAVIEMTCGDVDVTVSVFEKHLDAIIDNQNIKLEQTVSASGARYMAKGSVLNGVVLWNRGDDWLFFVNQDDAPVSCVLNTIQAAELPTE